MKQRTAVKTLTFSALGFSLVASVVAHAQLVEVETPRPLQERSESSDRLENTRPVSISAGMRPELVPEVQTQSRTTTKVTEIPGLGSDRGLNVAAPSTGIGGSNPGNANTGGVQVQSVNVQASPSVDVTSLSSNARSDVLRRERLRQEMNNETRLLERLEEGRISDESRRNKGIEAFSSNVASDNVVPVTGNATTATTVAKADNGSVANATTTIVQPIEAKDRGDREGGYGYGRDNEYGREGVEVGYREYDHNQGLLKITPFGGSQWNTGRSILKAQNQYVAGVGLESAMNESVSLEANFDYAKDQFRSGGYGNAYGNYAGFAGPSYSNIGGFGGNNCFGGFRSRSTYEFAGGIKGGMQMSRVRPFAAFDLGGQMNKYSADDGMSDQLTTHHVLADIGVGADVAVANRLSIGGRLDYRTALGSSNSALDEIYGDSASAYRLTGNVQFSF